VQGQSLSNYFQVSASAARNTFDMPPGGDVEPIGVNATLDADGERLVLTGVPPGRMDVNAKGQLTGWLPSVRVLADPDEPANVDIVYEGPDPSRRIVVRWSLGPFSAFAGEPPRIRLTKDGIDQGAPRELPRTPMAVYFEDLGPGPYVVEIDDPRCEHFAEAGVEPGTVVRAKLVGTAALKVQVLRGGKPLDTPIDQLLVCYVDSRSSLTECDVLQPDLLPVVDGFITGIQPG